MSRLPALQAPFEPAVGELLGAMMPPGAPPIGLFRTMVRNLPMTAAMHGFGAYELSRRLTVSLREREIVILRTCAGCGAEYEWGVHVEVFGPAPPGSPASRSPPSPAANQTTKFGRPGRGC